MINVGDTKILRHGEVIMVIDISIENDSIDLLETYKGKAKIYTKIRKSLWAEAFGNSDNPDIVTCKLPK